MQSGYMLENGLALVLQTSKGLPGILLDNGRMMETPCDLAAVVLVVIL